MVVPAWVQDALGTPPGMPAVDQLMPQAVPVAVPVQEPLPAEFRMPDHACAFERPHRHNKRSGSNAISFLIEQYRAKWIWCLSAKTPISSGPGPVQPAFKLSRSPGCIVPMSKKLHKMRKCLHITYVQDVRDLLLLWDGVTRLGMKQKCYGKIADGFSG
jgi:hypothetical protein